MHYAKLKIFLQYNGHQNCGDFWLLKHTTFQTQPFYNRFYEYVYGFFNYIAQQML